MAIFDEVKLVVLFRVIYKIVIKEVTDRYMEYIYLNDYALHVHLCTNLHVGTARYTLLV